MKRACRCLPPLYNTCLQVPATCMCLREGAVREYQARELVPGDVVHLGMGDRVPSDVRLFQATQLCVDESSFTGETEPAEKVRAWLRLLTVSLGSPAAH